MFLGLTLTKDSSDTHTVNHSFTASSNYNVEAGKCLRVKAEYEYLPVYLSPMSVAMLLTATYENGGLYKNAKTVITNSEAIYALFKNSGGEAEIYWSM